MMINDARAWYYETLETIFLFFLHLIAMARTKPTARSFTGSTSTANKDIKNKVSSTNSDKDEETKVPRKRIGKKKNGKQTLQALKSTSHGITVYNLLISPAVGPVTFHAVYLRILGTKVKAERHKEGIIMSYRRGPKYVPTTKNTLNTPDAVEAEIKNIITDLTSSTHSPYPPASDDETRDDDWELSSYASDDVAHYPEGTPQPER